MNALRYLAAALFCTIAGQAIGQNTLTVVVPNIKSIKGTMMVCLVTDKSEYLKDCAQGQMTKITSNSTKTIFADVAPGEYAVTIFQDKNNDQELNTNFIGIPKEPFGFSNNPTIMFGPPSYQKCLFTVDKDTTINVEL